MGQRERALRAVVDDQPRVVTPDNPLVITSAAASYPWVQIQPGGEVQVQVASTIDIALLEVITASKQEGT